MPSVILAGTTTGTALSLTSDTSGELQIQTNNGATTAMTLTTGGNVGIGVISPTSILDVRTSNPTRGIIASVVNTATSSQTGAQIRITQAGIEDWAFGQPAAVNAFAIWSGRSSSSDGTERMRIDQSGNVAIGTTAASGKLTVAQGLTFLNLTANGTAEVLKLDNSATAAGINTAKLSFSSAGVTKGSITTAVYNEGYMAFATNDDSEKMRLTAGGNLGIGTSSPGQVLEVSKSQDTETQIRVVNSSTGSSARSGTVYGNNSNAGAAGILLNSSNNTGLGGANALNVYMGLSAPIAFFTGGTERMRIDSGGSIAMGTSSNIYRGGGTLNLINTSNGQIVYRNDNQGAGKYWFSGVESSNDVFFIYPGTTSGGVYMTYGATSWTGNSDERLKTNLKPIKNAAEKVSTLRAVTGRFKADEENVSRSFLIAQDIQKVLPEAVDVRDDEMGTLGVRYTDIIPLLVAAIKEQQALIENLTTRLNALEGK
jgi:hypothetical protein